VPRPFERAALAAEDVPFEFLETHRSKPRSPKLARAGAFLLNRALIASVLATVAVAVTVLLASCGTSPQAGGGIGGTGNTATVVSGPSTL